MRKTGWRGHRRGRQRDHRRDHQRGPAPQLAEPTSLQRLVPRSGLPAHQHVLDEEWLLPEGELVVEVRLIRAGDYQLAPAAGGHFGEISDVGCTCCFDGAIDPVLVAPARS